MKPLKVATVFSGVGSFETALNNLGIKHEIVFACDNGEREISGKFEEIKKHILGLSSIEANTYVKGLYDATRKPNYVKQTYFANYDITEEKWYEDIRFLDGKPFKGQIDLYVGGSPCQSFSNMGKRKGLEDTRGTLFFEYARLIKEMQPKVFIYENVPGMLNHDKGNTWKTIKSVFDELGYHIQMDILNAQDYGLPQNRKRLFVIGFKNEHKFSFAPKIPLEKTMFDYLEEKVQPRFYLGKKGFEFVTNPIYFGRAEVNSPIIRTQKANQQFNWNGDFVFQPIEEVEHDADILKRAYVGQYKGQTGVCRQLTHRECFRLMGYPDTFKIVVPNVQAYRQAGNSIAVNVMEMVIKSIIETGVFE